MVLVEVLLGELIGIGIANVPGELFAHELDSYLNIIKCIILNCL